jgi:hypothetical protein
MKSAIFVFVVGFFLGLAAQEPWTVPIEPAHVNIAFFMGGGVMAILVAMFSWVVK